MIGGSSLFRAPQKNCHFFFRLFVAASDSGENAVAQGGYRGFAVTELDQSAAEQFPCGGIVRIELQCSPQFIDGGGAVRLRKQGISETKPQQCAVLRAADLRAQPLNKGI